MEIYICIGSSCHLKGSYDVIKAFKDLIAKNHLEDKVSLNASFCLGYCQNGVSARIDGRLVTGLNGDNAEDMFNKMVLKELR